MNTKSNINLTNYKMVKMLSLEFIVNISLIDNLLF